MTGPIHAGAVSSSSHHTAADPTLPSSSLDPSVQAEFFLSSQSFLATWQASPLSSTSISRETPVPRPFEFLQFLLRPEERALLKSCGNRVPKFETYDNTRILDGVREIFRTR